MRWDRRAPATDLTPGPADPRHHYGRSKLTNLRGNLWTGGRNGRCVPSPPATREPRPARQQSSHLEMTAQRRPSGSAGRFTYRAMGVIAWSTVALSFVCAQRASEQLVENPRRVRRQTPRPVTVLQWARPPWALSRELPWWARQPIAPSSRDRCRESWCPS